MPRAGDGEGARSEALRPHGGEGDDGSGREAIATPAAGRRTSLAALVGAPSLLGDAGHADEHDDTAHATAACGWLAGAGWRWGGWGVAYALGMLAFWWAMHSLYFPAGAGAAGAHECSADDLEKVAQHNLEYFVGWLPSYLRASLLPFLA